MDTIQVFEKDEKNVQREEEYLGIRNIFPDPYFFYLRLSDLEENNMRIKFIVLSMGKKKIVMTGWFNSVKDTFHIYYACKYATRELIKYTTAWKPKFELAFSTNKDRTLSRIDKFLGKKDKLISNYQDYKETKAFLSMQPLSKFYKEGSEKYARKILTKSMENKIKRDSGFKKVVEIRSELKDIYLSDDVERAIELSDEMNDALIEATKDLDLQIEEYERVMNRRDSYSKDKSFMDTSDKAEYVGRKFYEWISTSKYGSDSYTSELKDCKCDNTEDPGCVITSWGDYDQDSLV